MSQQPWGTPPNGQQQPSGQWPAPSGWGQPGTQWGSAPPGRQVWGAPQPPASAPQRAYPQAPPQPQPGQPPYPGPYGQPQQAPRPPVQQHPGQYQAARHQPQPYPAPRYPAQPQQFQPGQQSQPYGWGAPQGSPVPPRRGNPFLKALGGFALVVITGLFLIALASYLSAGDDEPAPGPNPTNTTGPAPTPTVPTTPSEPTTPVDPSDYNPSDLPAPGTYGEAERWVKSNGFYTTSVTAPTGCGLDLIDPTTASKAELQTHLNVMVTCLMAVWREPVESAGFELPRPPVTVYTQPITTGCGTIDDVHNAVYCGGDQRIYYGQKLYQIFPAKVATTPFMIDMVMGHEFAHLLQARTGILISANALGSNADSKAEAASLDRRVEQQADCWAGMFLNSVAQASGMDADMASDLGTVAYHLGDDVLSGKAGYVGGHGSGKARQRWFTSGQGTTETGTCNTFTVPDSQVR